VTLNHANTIIEHRALDSFGILFSAWKLQKYVIIQQTCVELSLCYYSIGKPIGDQVFSKVVVFPRYGMDGLDHGGTDYFFSQHVYFSTFKGNFQSHLLLFFILGEDRHIKYCMRKSKAWYGHVADSQSNTNIYDKKCPI
jgi:hypothetical protein